MSVRIVHGDCRAILPTLAEGSVQSVVTSPPYWGLRDYQVAGQLGLEATPEEYVAGMVGVFREVRRVLRDDGTLWLNMGDSYAGGGGYAPDAPCNQARANGDAAAWGKFHPAKMERMEARKGTGRIENLKPKDLIGMPWRLAFALQADGWFLRADIVWAKPNPMPESVTDRPTKAHEYIFLLTKSARYYYDADAVREPTQGDPRDARWGTTATTRFNDHAADHTQGMQQPKPKGFVAMSNPAGRNLRSVWTIPSAPFPEAHFATFPPALASRCLQAGTSAKGCCGACGAPWARQVAVDYVKNRPSAGNDPRSRDADRLGTARAVFGSSGWRGNNLLRDATTTGWHPSCACDPATPVVPCVVLDPFGGSGTVGMVAEQLGRHSILIELSPAYCAMARERTAQLGLFTQSPAA